MKTVIEMALEAGCKPFEFGCTVAHTTDLERFAKLIRADEREACAKVAITIAEQDLPDEMPEGEELLRAVRQIVIGGLIAKAIRARGNT